LALLAQAVPPAIGLEKKVFPTVQLAASASAEVFNPKAIMSACNPSFSYFRR
jgi:hypothetical protein